MKLGSHRDKDPVQRAGSPIGEGGGVWRRIFRKKRGREQPVVPADARPTASSARPSLHAPGGPSGDASNNSSSIGDQITKCDHSHSNQSLWDRAYEALEMKSPDLVTEYQNLLAKEAEAMGSASNMGPSAQGTPLGSVAGATGGRFNRAQLITISRSGLARMEETKTKYTIGGLEIVPRDQIANVAGLALWAKDWIGDAVKASPEASIAWAGVCIILPLLTNAKVANEASRDGFTYVTARMRYYTALEPLVQELGLGSDAAEALTEANDYIVFLYQHILEFQIRSILRFYQNHLRRYVGDALLSQDWSKMRDGIEKLEATVNRNLRQVNELVARQKLELLNKTSTKSFETVRQLLSVSEQQLRAMEKHVDIAQRQLSLQEDAVKRELSEKEEKCHQLFRLTSGDKDATYEWYKNRVEVRLEGTCQWFLTHDHFQGWLEQESGTLLVSADPGCGKSVLARYLIDDGLPRSATICYFFFKDQDQCTVRQALCALLHQLFSQKPFLIKHAMPEYSNNGEALVKATASLWKILDSAVRDSQAGTVIIVLDALDECAEMEFKNLVEHVKRPSHSNQPGDCKLKFLLTSRPYNQIVSEFQDLLDDFPRVHIPGEKHSEAIGQEINIVIRDRVSRLRLSDHIKERLTEKLLGISHRTYLWVHLVFDHLKTEGFKKTPAGVESAIATLPKNVNEAYEQILRKARNHQGARKALAIILAARRPLTLSEMNIAVNIQEDHKVFRDLDLEDDEDFGSNLRSWCGLFISIYRGKVYFLHQTAREFLLADPSSSAANFPEPRWHRSITVRHAHTVLAEQCVLYLNLFNSAKPDHDVGGDAFLNYSAEYWSFHFHEADIADNDSIIPSVLRICDPKSGSYSAWSRDYWKAIYGTEPKDWTRILILSHFGHEAVVKLLLAEEAIDVNSKDERGWTPLSLAAEGGHKAVVKLLLAEKAIDVNSKDEQGWTPLLLAARGGHKAVVKLLLAEKAIDVNSKDEQGWTPLLLAAGGGHEAVVKLLLAEEAVDANSKDKRGRTPLSHATERGNEAIVTLLLAEETVDVNLKNKRGRTPLSYAAKGGYEAVVKLLLAEETVDVSSKDMFSRTPLSYAAERGYGAIVTLLERS